MSPERKKGIRLEAARIFADAEGVPWTLRLLERLAICQSVYLEYDARVQKADLDNAEFLKGAGAVN